MTDINQWRRRIQPSRSRTPLPSADHEGLSAETTPSPDVPRRKLRPKLSSYFSHHVPPAIHGKSEALSAEYTFSASQSAYDPPISCQPEPEALMESMMRKVMADPFHAPDVRDNSSLMMIFEAYHSLREQNADLSEKLKTEVDSRYAVELEAERAEKRWQQEREEYKAEVKRLELLIAKGKRGLADVIKARQGSVLRNKKDRNKEDSNAVKDRKETVFEFLERTRAEDLDATKSQRGM